MSALPDDYLTVTEAASLLRVAPSTVRRWIRRGEVPAYRLGPRRVALRRTDVAALVAPIRPDVALEDGAAEEEDAWAGEPDEALSAEEAQQRAQAVEFLEQIRAGDAERRKYYQFRKLTEEEKQEALAALEEARKAREAITDRRGGKRFSPSWMILNELRDERTRQLTGE